MKISNNKDMRVLSLIQREKKRGYRIFEISKIKKEKKLILSARLIFNRETYLE